MRKNQIHNTELTLLEKQKLEKVFWEKPSAELPDVDSISNIINKISDAEVFIECLNQFNNRHSANGRILELGTGRCWASCLYKKIYSDCEIIATDISKIAIDERSSWERIWNVKIDQAYSCLSYETKEEDNSIDLIFTFASAHHFLAHNRTLKEISRILKPGASALYLYDTGCTKAFYPYMYKLVNKIRPNVPEDVLILSTIKNLAKKNHLECDIKYYPSVKKRGTVQNLYFSFLTTFPILQKILPCTVNIVFTKKN